MYKYLIILLYFVVLMLAIVLSSCTTTDSIIHQKSDVFYLKNIRFDVESSKGKKSFVGSGVVESDTKLKITVYPKGNADLISVASCHREMRIEDPDKKMFEKGYSFEFMPVEGLESGRACPIEIGVYDKKGRHGWGFLAIKNKLYQLPSVIKCNGETSSVVGVSTCQSRVGLVQEYYFNSVVEPVFAPECDIKGQRGQRFTFQIPRGSCTVYFVDVTYPSVIHQANLFGYDEILLKE